MHPLLDNLNAIKMQLLAEGDGICLDIFTLPNDMQIFSSTRFSHVVCTARDGRDCKLIKESAPSRPVVYAYEWDLGLVLHRTFLRTTLTLLGQQRCIWIHLHRVSLDGNALNELFSLLYETCADSAMLYIVCVDGARARQYAKSRQVYVDSDGQMHMQYHKQSINTVPLAELMTICAANGFIYRNSINGADILTQCKTNCLPYDRWTSETFCLLQFQCRSHFRNLC